MIRPNYRDYRGTELLLVHSAEGSSWKKHKYIKRIDGTYYYPRSYQGGRHLPEGAEAEATGGGSTFGEYTDGDPDFDDKNFDEKNRLGDTDFFSFTRPDGTVVLLEEDMKWELPKGAKVTPELINRLQYMNEVLLEMDAQGIKRTADQWQQMAKDSIDAAIKSGGKAPAMKVEDIKKMAKEEVAKSQKGSSEKLDLSKDDIEDLAKEVVQGKFGNGQTRKDLLGENYSEIQKRVNELMKGSTGSKKVSKEAGAAGLSKAEEAAKRAVELTDAHRKSKK